MSAPTVRAINLEGEEAFREALIKIRNELRKFSAASRPEIRTPELWARYYDLDATAVWLEDSLLRMQRARYRREERAKNRATRGSIRDTYGWQKRGGRKRGDDED